MKGILVVGAGLAGATYARELAEAGHRVEVIDRRPHIAGNAFDMVDETGVRRHVYGPHLFHTSSERVMSWLRRFTEFVPYQHRVSAWLPAIGRGVPLLEKREKAHFMRIDADEWQVCRDQLAAGREGALV